MTASTTFPAGFTITEFADDADPVDFPAQEIMGSGGGVNGDLVVWSKYVPNDITINVIPGSDSDQNLQILLLANKVGKNKSSARDIIDATVIYPDGTTRQLNTGFIKSGMPGNGIASEGREKSKAYAFTFESIV